MVNYRKFISLGQRKDPKSGKFVRTRYAWTPEKWNEGYIDSRGYFRVYRPDYPKTYTMGYAKRSHVVWWLKTKMVLADGYALHHKNGNKLDDGYKNLELVEHGQHSLRHNLIRREVISHQCKCKNCGKEFTMLYSRISEKECRRGRFCSQLCYHSYPRSIKHRESISLGLRIAYKEGRR